MVGFYFERRQKSVAGKYCRSMHLSAAHRKT